MTRFASRTLPLALCAAFTLTGPLLALSAAGHAVTHHVAGVDADDKVRLDAWSNQIWEAAIRGQTDVLETRLEKLPELQSSPKAVAEFESFLERREQHFKTARANRLEAYSKAETDLDDHVQKGDLTLALTKAVEMQTLADEGLAVLGDDRIRELVTKADSIIPEAERRGDWLLAQELLYRLNVLFEHSGEYKNELDKVNRRVALLANYAPRRLYDLRKQQAERLDPDREFPAFNEARLEDLQERLRDVDSIALRQSLRLAAQRHIEAAGWNPLVKGGLESLRILATTPALSEQFPALEDAAKVSTWTEQIDSFSERIDALTLTDRDADNILARLLELNDGTIKLPSSVLLREFGDGAMSKLDTYSEVIWPDEVRRFEQATRGDFVGVGILIRHDDKRDIMVVNPLEGSPAYFAGVKPEDRVVAVDGKSTVGWSLNDAVDKITGPRGEEVTLSIRREGVEDLLEISVKRDVVKLHSVNGWWKTGLGDEGDPEWDWYLDRDNGVAYIKLTQFSDHTYDDLNKAWRQINQTGTPRGLILDLRYNPGGLLDAAVNISNLFMPEGPVVSGEGKDGVTQFERRARRHRATIFKSGLPVVVLINEGSASASEIVAGALQANNAAVIVGERSFGKGSVQTVHPVTRNTMLKLTTQYYRLPPAEGETKGRIVHRRPGASDWGVNPDIEVGMSPNQIVKSLELRQQADMLTNDPEDAKDRPDVNRLLTEGLDPQLETAVLILRAKALASVSMPGSRAALD